MGEEILSVKEKKRLKQMLSCTSCPDLCAKAVSMDCCYPSATCRKCALRSLRENNTRCWGCGKVSEDVFTPSHLINNDLVHWCCLPQGTPGRGAGNCDLR